MRYISNIILNTIHLIRYGWLVLGISLCLCLALELSARGYYLVRKATAHQQPARAYQVTVNENSEVYKDVPWTRDLYREQLSCTTKWQPIVYWRRRPFQGDFIQVDQNGFRETGNRTTRKQADVKIFMFGGSTMWGTGSRNDHTIPSLVAKHFHDQGLQNVYVQNFGQPGYVAIQEVLQLILELKAGNIPDHVVFLDGVNDSFSVYQNRLAGIPQNEDNRRLEFNSSKRTTSQAYTFFHDLTRRSEFLNGAKALHIKLTQKMFSEEAPSDNLTGTSTQNTVNEELARQAVQDYLANIDLVQRLAQAYHFKVDFFWQPLVYTKTPLTEQEQTFVDNTNPALRSFYKRVYELVQAESIDPSCFHDLQALFVGHKEQLYIDFCHYSEKANQMIADQLVGYLSDRLAKKMVQ